MIKIISVFPEYTRSSGTPDLIEAVVFRLFGFPLAEYENSCFIIGELKTLSIFILDK